MFPRKNRIEPHAAATAEFKAVSDVADFPEQSCEQVFHRFFHCSDSGENQPEILIDLKPKAPDARCRSVP
jgi:hypothetical protein